MGTKIDSTAIDQVEGFAKVSRLSSAAFDSGRPMHSPMKPQHSPAWIDSLEDAKQRSMGLVKSSRDYCQYSTLMSQLETKCN